MSPGTAFGSKSATQLWADLTSPLPLLNPYASESSRANAFGRDLFACPIAEGCFCKEEDLLHHLVERHKIQVTSLDESGSFRMALCFTIPGHAPTQRSGVIIELDQGRQHLFWLLERKTDMQHCEMELWLAVYTLPNYAGPELGVRIAAQASEEAWDQKVWKGHVHTLSKDGVKPRTVCMKYSKGEQDMIFGVSEDGERRKELSVVVDTTVMVVVADA